MPKLKQIEQRLRPASGNQTTVAFKSVAAEEYPKGFKIPNQKKIIPKDIRNAGIPIALILLAIF